MYITLEDYLEMGGRHVTDQADFERYEFRARMILDQRTQNRITEPSDKIRRLMVELIDLDFNETEREVTSTSNDGVSVRYSKRNEDYYKSKADTLISAYCGDLAWRGLK